MVSTALGSQFALTLVAISQPTANSFNCDVYLPPASGSFAGGLNPSEVGAVLNDLQWAVAWMGIDG
jgi:hypothetical protein